ncbi:MAG: hypothetical protein QOJ07_45, partial [Thermoleophilaceae bacterium]|nr:hypothetical protein [Thermoleophilaceae bacterium]
MDPQTIPDTASAAGAEVALGALLRDDATNALARRLGSAARTTVRVSESMLPLLLAALHALRAETDRPALSVVVEDDDAARELAEAVVPYRTDAQVGYLPHRGAAWGSPLIPPPHLVGERARALDVLAAGGIVIVSAEALVERIGGRDSRTAPVRVAVGDVIERDDLLAALVESGYERVGGTVDERGQISARGDVVDVFPTTGREPIRIELFGDEVERVSAFSSLTQRSLRDLGRVAIYPAQELPEADGAAAFADADDGLEIPPGLVSLAPELLAAGALIAWEPRLVAAAADERLAEVATPASRRRGYLRVEDVRELVDGLHAFDALPQGQAVVFEAQRPAIAARGIAETENELRAQVRAGQRVLVAFPHRGDAERTSLLLKRVDTELLEPGATLPSAPGVYLVVSRLRRGLVSQQLALSVLPSAQLFRRKAADSRIGRAVRSFTDLRPGDYVVHEEHGVGHFVGFDTKTVAGVTRDYLCLDFKGSDKLFVPHEQIAKVSRYIGSDARAPSLSKLGGKAWHTLKARARHAVHELAGELLALYAARQASEKQPIVGDGELMEVVERGFPYTETDDQVRAIDAVMTDLESGRPMDRLLCGDVGFGKTEVALRAAAKIVESGRQVLMLVPTTILAQQHYGTFTERLKDYPFTIEHVSRFRSAAGQKKAIEGFQKGAVDILIGTHRILSR